MNTYKFRCEILSDADQFLKLIEGNYFDKKVERFELPLSGADDRIITFNSELSKEALQLEMNKIDDSHVMIETLELESNYTGERKAAVY